MSQTHNSTSFKSLIPPLLTSPTTPHPASGPISNRQPIIYSPSHKHSTSTQFHLPNSAYDWLAEWMELVVGMWLLLRSLKWGAGKDMGGLFVTFLSKQIKTQFISILIISSLIVFQLGRNKRSQSSSNAKIWSRMLIIVCLSLQIGVVSSQATLILNILPNCALDDADHVLCLQCEDGYSVNSSMVCDNCIDAYCKVCTLPNVVNACTECLDGYYYTTGSGCLGCSYPFCQTCNSTRCLTCVTGYIYSVGNCNPCNNTLVGCQQCSNSATCKACMTGFILNVKVCNTCAVITGCTACTDLSSCTACNTNGYYLPANDTICYPCSASTHYSNCQICDYQGNNCNTCQPNFMLFANTSSVTCVNCNFSVPNCSTCNQNYCLTCESNFILSASYRCDPCSSVLTSCLTCNNASDCTSCLPDNIIMSYASGHQCLACSSAIPGCVHCTINAVCTECTNTYYLSAGRCPSCSSTLIYCISCTNNLTCTQCLQSKLYALNSVSQCETCSTFMVGCYRCQNSTSCINCVNTNYYLNSTSNLCLPCSNHFPGCISCTLTACTFCQTGFHANYKGECVCDVGKQISGICIDVYGCSTIITTPFILPICTACEVGLIFRDGQCFCPDGEWFVTGICTNIAGCVAMKQTGQIETCIFCDLSQKLVINSAGVCECKPNYYMSGGSCQQICGDGILITLPCDDNNTLNDDGCSSTCQIESGYKCSLLNGISQCIFQIKFKIELVSIEKIPDVNSGKFVFLFSPKNANLAKMNFTKYLNLSIPGATITLTTTTYSDGFLQIGFDYGNDLTGKQANLVLDFDPLLFKSSSFKLTFRVEATGLKLSFMVKQKIYKILEYIILGLEVLGIGIFFISLPLHKMIGVETIQVFQIFFMILLIFEEYEQPYNKLGVLRWTMGFLNLFQYDKSLTPFVSGFYSKLTMVKDYVINQIVISPLILIISMAFMFFAAYYFQNNVLKKVNKEKQASMILRCRGIYRFALFPIVIGFSFSAIISLYAFCLNTQFFSVAQNSNFMSFLASAILILPFCLVYPIIFASEVILPFQELLGKALLRIEKAKTYYVPMYLTYSLLLIIFFLVGYQISQQTALYATSLVIIIYAIIVIKVRPYQEFIHCSSVIINQLSLVVLMVCLIYRSNKLQSGVQLQEEDNFLLMLVFLCCLIVVDILALVRVIILLKEKFSNCCLKHLEPTSPLPMNLKESILRKRSVQMEKDDSTLEGNPYMFANQYLKRKQKQFAEQNQARIDLQMPKLQLEPTSLLKHELATGEKYLRGRNGREIHLLTINLDQSGVKSSKQLELIKLKQKLRQNLQTFKHQS